MKFFLSYLHWILIGAGVLLLVIHFFAHLESNVPLTTALLLEVIGIVLFVVRLKES